MEILSIQEVLLLLIAIVASNVREMPQSFVELEIV